MITTLNRVDDLLKTLHFLKSLNPLPYEVMVTADGCSDDTVERVAKEFPEVRLFVNSIGRGSVASRHRMMQETNGDLVLALDDDSHPEQKDCVCIISDTFELSPNLAVAAFPQRTDEYPQTLQMLDFGPEMTVKCFANSGACIRVSFYRSLPGFEGDFGHMYEEPDYVIQCLAAGCDVKFIPSITIRHHWVPRQRNEIRNHHLHARNELWSVLLRCPNPFLLFVMIYKILSQMRYSFKKGGFPWLIKEPVWWYQAMVGILRIFVRRNPVCWKGYKKWLRAGSPKI